jgi:hypothetical protein
MARVELKSTSLHAATYEEQSSLLELEFRSGASYRYSGVPAQTYQELMLAESKGRYFNQHIRNRFTYAKSIPRATAQLGFHPQSTRRVISQNDGYQFKTDQHTCGSRKKYVALAKIGRPTELSLY